MTTTTLQAPFLREAQTRGFIHQSTDLDGLDELMARQSINAYIGFDATAAHLHAGHLLTIMLMRLLQKHGHTPIVVLGGGTTLVGDPSGKDQTRPIQQKDSIQKNIDTLTRTFDKLLKHDTTRHVVVNNADWLAPLNLISFLRDVGKHFSINRMLSVEAIKARLQREQNLSFLEFAYMLLQAYDFLVLAQRHDCRLQIGGSDQWGNIVAGIDLAKKYDTHPLFGMTVPLLTTAQGKKMGKTEKGSLWLDEHQTSAWQYWQFWRNCDDKDVASFLHLFTELDTQAIDTLVQAQGQQLNEAKKALADETTTLLYGEKAAAQARKGAEQTFEDHTSNANMPQYTMRHDTPIVQLLVDTKLCSSRGDAKRLIQQGGIKINQQVITDDQHLITRDDKQPFTLAKGKKQRILIQRD